MASTWQAVSEEIAQVIDRAGKSIVAVDGRAGHTSSGIVWRKDAVITAAHSIRHDTGIRVILGPERSVQARLAGRDRGADIAVLRLDQEVEAPPPALGNPAALTIGNLTVAIARTRRGNIVASAGIIGGLIGEWQARRTRIDQFIRPDLTLYPGFSGGALVGADGLVLGLNTSGLLRGRPLTIPSTTLKRIADEIASKGHVTRPYIGLVMQPVQIPESLQQTAGVKTGTGLLVMHVEPGGPADAAGVVLGDVVVELDGATFGDLEDIHQVLDRKAAGAEVQATLLRGGNKVQLAIRIGTRPSS
jgi:S1-C subfamily serine protease